MDMLMNGPLKGYFLWIKEYLPSCKGEGICLLILGLKINKLLSSYKYLPD